jgi:hypothetical protein
VAAQFSFDVDPACDLLRVTMAGFFLPEDIDAFLAARAAAHARLTCPPNQHLTLTDIRGMEIQTQEGVTEFRRLLADSRFHARKLAFVVDSTLIRGQLARAVATRAVRFFLDVASAETWLFDDADRAAA